MESMINVVASVGAASGMPVARTFRVRTGVSPVAVAVAPCVPMKAAGWQRPGTDSAAAAHAYALTTITRTAVAGVRPGLRSTSPPV